MTSAACPAWTWAACRRDEARRAGPRDAPARYTEASLVKALEDRGIGRPSTYAAIMGTILDRGYVFKKGTALVPTFVAFAVTQLLEGHFERLVDYDFTARMEDDLDRIAAGRRRAPSGCSGSTSATERRAARPRHRAPGRDRRTRSTRSRSPGATWSRVGRYGPYLERGEERASLPPDVAPDELTASAAEELLTRPSDDRSLGPDPETGYEILVKSGRYGPYVTEILPEGAEGKPRTASLFGSMSPETVTLDEALRLLTLPRTSWRRTPRTSCSPTAAMALREERVGDPLAGVGGAALHADGRRGARDPGAATAAPRSRRGEAAVARARHGFGPGSRSWSRRVASARTSRTVRRTPACAARTTSPRSHSSGRRSSWRNGAPRGRRRSGAAAADGTKSPPAAQCPPNFCRPASYDAIGTARAIE